MSDDDSDGGDDRRMEELRQRAKEKHERGTAEMRVEVGVEHEDESWWHRALMDGTFLFVAAGLEVVGALVGHGWGVLSALQVGVAVFIFGLGIGMAIRHATMCVVRGPYFSLRTLGGFLGFFA